MDSFLPNFLNLSKDGAFVHTSLRRICDIFWNQLKIAVLLHQKKYSYDSFHNALSLVFNG